MNDSEFESLASKAWKAATDWHHEYVKNFLESTLQDIRHHVNENGKFADEEALNEYWQENVEQDILNDGTDLVYTNKAKLFLLASRNEDAWLENGFDETDQVQEHVRAGFALIADLMDRRDANWHEEFVEQEITCQTCGDPYMENDSHICDTEEDN